MWVQWAEYVVLKPVSQGKLFEEEWMKDAEVMP